MLECQIILEKFKNKKKNVPCVRSIRVEDGFWRINFYLNMSDQEGRYEYKYRSKILNIAQVSKTNKLPFFSQNHKTFFLNSSKNDNIIQQ